MAHPQTNSAQRPQRTPQSLRRTLLIGILLPVLLFVAVDTVSLYRKSLQAVNTAYDRTLLASAKAIGELLVIEGEGPQARLRGQIPYAALEAFEADNRSRMNYRVSDAQGQWIDGTPALRAWNGTLPAQGPYAALVDFYDDTLQDDPVRVAVLLQPVASSNGRAMATIQVAETLELRRTLARQILVDTLVRQAILISVIVAVVLVVVQRATRPVRRLSVDLSKRTEDDLTPITAPDLPREMLPLTEATNQVMARLQHLLDHQKRFVRDAAHQLRTPLAVLKVQVQSARRGDIGASDALREIEGTVDRATTLANQMLSLAKVEQLKQQQDYAVLDWADVGAGMLMGLLLIAVRTASKVGCNLVAARLSGITERKGLLTGLALTPMSAFAILLLEQTRLYGFAPAVAVLSAMAGMMVVQELLGPIVTQRALMTAHETHVTKE